MDLTERIKALCDGKNTTFAGLERDLQLGQGTIRKWDKSSPSIEKLQKVADYFDVSLDYLVGKEDKTLGLDGIYLSLAKTAQDLELNPHDVDLIIRTVKEIKRHEKDDAE